MLFSFTRFFTHELVGGVQSFDEDDTFFDQAGFVEMLII